MKPWRVTVLLAIVVGACSDEGPKPSPEQIVFLSSRAGAVDQFGGRLYDIYRVNADGTDTVNLTHDPASYSHLQLSPAGGKIVFSASSPTSSARFGIWTMNVDGTGQTKITNNGAQEGSNSQPRWSPDGTKIAFTSNREGRVFGTQNGVPDVYVMNADGSSPHNVSFSVAASMGSTVTVLGWHFGKVVFQSDINGAFRTWLVNPDGSDATLLFSGTTDRNPVYSPDGSKIVFIRRENGGDRIYVTNVLNTSLVPLTTHPPTPIADRIVDTDYSPWSPDGARIVFQQNGGGENQTLWIVNVDGTGLRKIVPVAALFNGWSPNSNRLAYSAIADEELWTIDPEGTQPLNVTKHPAHDTAARWVLRR